MFDDFRFFTFGDLLRSYRERHGAQRHELEETTGRHRNTIGAWERGDNLPKLREDILLLADNLHLSKFETDLLLHKADFPLEYHNLPSPVIVRPGTAYGYLHIRNPRETSLSFSLLRDRHQLGRHRDRCDLVIPPEYERVSRVHAAITWVLDQVYIEDCDSTNGTYMDGRPVEKPTQLEAGQHVTLGGRTASHEVCILEYSLEPVETRRD